MDRLAMLQDLLTQDPNNQLARYGLAMEYSGKGEVDARWRSSASSSRSIRTMRMPTSWPRRRWPRPSGLRKPSNCYGKASQRLRGPETVTRKAKCRGSWRNWNTEIEIEHLRSI